MLESSSALRDGLQVLGVGVLVGLLEGPKWHAGAGYLSGGRTLLMHSPSGPAHGSHWGGHASKQEDKALRSRGHPQRTKRCSILATLKKKKRKYVHKNIGLCTEVG